GGPGVERGRLGPGIPRRGLREGGASRRRAGDRRRGVRGRREDWGAPVRRRAAPHRRRGSGPQRRLVGGRRGSHAPRARRDPPAGRTPPPAARTHHAPPPRCPPPPAAPGSGRARATRPGRAPCWRRSTRASPKGSTLPTSSRRGRCSTSSGDEGALRAQGEALPPQVLRDLPQTLGAPWIERVRRDPVAGVGRVVHRGGVTVFRKEPAAPREL